MISEAGHVLTCWHVVANGTTPRVVFRGNTEAQASVVFSDIELDVAILATGVPQEHYPEVGSARMLDVGDRVLIASFPSVGNLLNEQTPTVVTAAISNITPSYLKLDRATGIGSSGGAVFCEKTGRLVGIIIHELVFVELDSRPVPTGQAGFAFPIDRALEPLALYAGINPIIDTQMTKTELLKAVEGTLRATGYSVRTGYKVLGSDIDFLAIKREFGSTFRLGVQCELSAEPLGVSPIRALSHAIAVSRSSSQPIDKGIVVSNTSPSNETTLEATAAGISVLTLESFLTNAIDFRPYVQHLIDTYEHLVYSNYFVTASCQTEDGVEESVLQYILGQVRADECSPIAVLGDFGMGKSALCHRIAYELAVQWDEYGGATPSRLPVHVPLFWCGKNSSLVDVAISRLREALGVAITLDSFLYLSRLGRFVFVMDGLDEMSDQVNSTTLSEHIREFLSFLKLGDNRLILSCRSHFFRRKIDEKRLVGWNILRLLPWEEQHWKTYLRGRSGEHWEAQWTDINSIYNLVDLAGTPMLLEMITSSLEQLRDTKHTIDSSLLYSIYTNSWLLEQSTRKGSILDAESKARLLEEIAFRMLASDSLHIEVQELERLLAKKLNIAMESIPSISNDLRTCSFLVRKGDSLAFAHTSFMEFFVASKYHREITSGDIEDFGKVYFKEEIFRFLVQLIARQGGVESLHMLLSRCSVVRGRIHLIFLLGALGMPESVPILKDLLQRDEYSRVSGHAAEILLTKFSEETAFEQLISALREEPYSRNRHLPEELSLGWFTVAGERAFEMPSGDTVRFFLDVVGGQNYGDPNLRWYAASVLSRISNLPQIVTSKDIKQFSHLVKEDPLARVRAYSALVLKNLRSSNNEVISTLRTAADKDEDPSVRKAAGSALEECLNADHKKD